MAYHNAVKQKFITDYISQNGPVSMQSEGFVDSYCDRFDCKHKSLGTFLLKLFNAGVLDRQAMKTYHDSPTAAKWLYFYDLSKYWKVSCN